MKEIINKFLLTGDKLMPELHLKHPGFTYSACGPFTKHREIIQKFREIDNLKHLDRNELDKGCFAHDAAYSDSKDLPKGTISEKILKDRTYEIARNRGYDGYQRALASMFYTFFDKKTGSGINVTDKPVTKNFKRRKADARFKDNIWAADLVEMELWSSKNKMLNIYYVS